jgi:DNA-directed RNA polymerase subunit RPC12/RpoP
MTRSVINRSIDSLADQRFAGPDHLVDYICGNCNTVLLHAVDNLKQNLLIVCTECGAHNSTDAPAT